MRLFNLHSPTLLDMLFLEHVIALRHAECLSPYLFKNDSRCPKQVQVWDFCPIILLTPPHFEHSALFL